MATLLLRLSQGCDLKQRDADVDIELAREILRYFIRNPKAVDTVSGVARWRLLDEVIHRNLQKVSKAIAWLVSEGFLVKVVTAGSDTVVHLNERRVGETRRFLNSRAPATKGGKRDKGKKSL